MADYCIVTDDLGTLMSLAAVLPDDATADVLWLAEAPDQLADVAGRFGIHHVTVVRPVRLTDACEVVGPAIRGLLQTARVVVLDSSQASRDLAGWCTAVLASPVIWAADAIRLEDRTATVDRIVLGGDYRLVHEADIRDSPLVVLAKPTAQAATRGNAPARISELDVACGVDRLQVEAAALTETGGVRLTSARIVGAVGRGI